MKRRQSDASYPFDEDSDSEPGLVGNSYTTASSHGERSDEIPPPPLTEQRRTYVPSESSTSLSPGLHKCLFAHCGWPGGLEEHESPTDWVSHVHSHFKSEQLPNKPALDSTWQYNMKCGRCDFPFRERSWKTIVSHIYDRHVKPKAAVRTCDWISPDLSCYLKFKNIIPAHTRSKTTDVEEDIDAFNKTSDHNPDLYRPRRFANDLDFGGIGDGLSPIPSFRHHPVLPLDFIDR